MSCNLRKMSPQEYANWIKDSRKRDASLPSFFGSGETRTMRVLQGTASEASVNKWESFKARHGTSFCENPTYRRGIALRNWGIQAPLKGLKK